MPEYEHHWLHPSFFKRKCGGPPSPRRRLEGERYFRQHGNSCLADGMWNPQRNLAHYCQAILQTVPQDFSRVQIGRTLVLYRAEEHRVLELLKNLALGRVFQHMQARTHAKARPNFDQRRLSILERVSTQSYL